MAAIICPHCGKYISSFLTTCPECGKSVVAASTATPSNPQTEADAAENAVIPHTENAVKPLAENAEIPLAENSDETHAENAESPLADKTSVPLPGILADPIVALPLTVPTTVGTEAESTSDGSVPPQRKSWLAKISGRRIATATLLLLLLSGATYFFVKDHQRAVGLEQRAFDRLTNCPNLLWYEDYIVRFPDGKHIDEVKKMYEQAKVEQTDFFNKTAGGTREELLAFIKQHPTSPYIIICQNRIDSLDWNLATSTNTVASYDKYLAEHPDGIFVTAANSNRMQQQRLEVTEDERNMISGAIHNFLTAMTSGEPTRVSDLVSAHLNFCGLTDATGDDVLKFYTDNFHRNDILGVHFTLKGGMNIKKLPTRESDNLYNYTINAQLEATLNRSALDSAAVQTWSLTAGLTPDRKFTSVNLHQ